MEHFVLIIIRQLCRKRKKRMIVSQVNIGNIFEYIPIIGGESELGIRLLGESAETSQIIYCVLDVDYCIMDPDFEVLMLDSIEKLTIKDELVEKTKSKLLDLEDGKVFQVSGPYGLLSTYCKTKFKVFGGIICATLTTPTQILFNVDVNDLGPTSDYNGLPDEGLRRIDTTKE